MISGNDRLIRYSDRAGRLEEERRADKSVLGVGDGVGWSVRSDGELSIGGGKTECGTREIGA